MISILLGESLVNDASALILYRGAVGALITGLFSPGELVVRFFVDATVGIMVGLFVGWLIVQAAKRSNDALAETALTLLGPYLAWIAGEYLHVSAVLACVAGGIYVRQHFSSVVAPASRIQSRAVWDLFLFGLNSLVFLLLGAEFGNLLEVVPAATLETAGKSGLLIAGLVILVRLIWVPLGAIVPRWLSPKLRVRDPMPSISTLFVIAWTGMRGMVSLAAALALPLVTLDGTPTPFRVEIVTVTVVVILVTLVLQGLTLIPLFKRLPLPHDSGPELEESHARAVAKQAALEHLTDLSEEPWATPEEVERVSSDVRLSHLPSASPDEAVARGHTLRRVRLTTVEAKRRGADSIADEGAISDEVLFALENELATRPYGSARAPIRSADRLTPAAEPPTLKLPALWCCPRAAGPPDPGARHRR